MFHFTLLALMVCRGSTYVKAGYLFDLVRSNKNTAHKTDKNEATLIWSNPRLKHAIACLLIYSDLLPKVYYNKVKGEQNTSMSFE